MKGVSTRPPPFPTAEGPVTERQPAHPHSLAQVAEVGTAEPYTPAYRLLLPAFKPQYVHLRP